MQRGRHHQDVIGPVRTHVQFVAERCERAEQDLLAPLRALQHHMDTGRSQAEFAQRQLALAKLMEREDVMDAYGFKSVEQPRHRPLLDLSGKGRG